MSRLSLSSCVFPCLLAACIAANPNSAFAQQEVEERAVEMLRDACNHLREADSVTARIRINHELHTPNADHRRMTEFDFASEPPNNKFALRGRQEGAVGVEFVSDGDMLTIHVPAFNVYAQKDAPDGLRDFMEKSIGEDDYAEKGGHPMSLIHAINEAAVHNAEHARLKRAHDSGTIHIADTEAQRIELTLVTQIPGKTAERLETMLGHDLESNEVEADLVAWMVEGNPTTFRMIRVDEVRFMDEDLQSMREQFMRYSGQRLRVDYRDWTFGESISADKFEFDAPDDAIEVETIDPVALLYVMFPRR